jgi:hypothetical protein
MRSRFAVAFSVGSLACGAQANAPTETQTATGAPSASTSASVATTKGRTDATQLICQTLIELPKLQQYFHLEVPERKNTVRMLRGSPCDGTTLKHPKGNFAFVEVGAIDARLAISIDRFVSTPDVPRSLVSFRLDGEGIIGEAIIEVQNGRATIIRETVAER